MILIVKNLKSATLPWLAMILVIITMIFVLHSQGRRWWCACGQPALWAGDNWSPHNSQHLLDPYSFTHILHGLVFCGLWALLIPGISPAWRGFLTIVLAAGWEIVENTQYIIDRYRQATMALGYQGDSIANSLGDIVMCSLGFVLARALGWRKSALLFVFTELWLLLWIKDNLTLNIIMLIYPLDAIKAWQMH